MAKEKKKERSSSSKSDSMRMKLRLGIFFIVISFLGIGVVFYLLYGQIRDQNEELATLQEQTDLIEEERIEMEQTQQVLVNAIGREISLERIIQQAETIYDKDVKSAREGYLWVDRSSKTWVVTLGALNGLVQGSRLAVYKGAERVDTVQVSTPMDVISYVIPTDNLKNQYEFDYFRVAIE